jgi:cytochrome c
MRRSMRLALIVGAALMVMLLVPTVGAQEEVDGREVYLAECSACHQGTGLGVKARRVPSKSWVSPTTE